MENGESMKCPFPILAGPTNKEKRSPGKMASARYGACFATASVPEAKNLATKLCRKISACVTLTIQWRKRSISRSLQEEHFEDRPQAFQWDGRFNRSSKSCRLPRGQMERPQIPAACTGSHRDFCFKSANCESVGPR